MGSRSFSGVHVAGSRSANAVDRIARLADVDLWDIFRPSGFAMMASVSWAARRYSTSNPNLLGSALSII
jgi:hypothetical protein